MEYKFEGPFYSRFDDANEQRDYIANLPGLNQRYASLTVADLCPVFITSVPAEATQIIYSELRNLDTYYIKRSFPVLREVDLEEEGLSVVFNMLMARRATLGMQEIANVDGDLTVAHSGRYFELPRGVIDIELSNNTINGIDVSTLKMPPSTITLNFPNLADLSALYHIRSYWKQRKYEVSELEHMLSNVRSGAKVQLRFPNVNPSKF